MDPNKSQLLAALILAVAIVTGSVLVKSSLDRGALEVKTSLDELHATLSSANRGARRGAAANAGARREVQIAGAPSRGAKGAKITLVEFSDFQ